MFEETKKFLYKSACEQGKPSNRLLDKNIRLIERDKDNLEYNSDGYAYIFEYLQFFDDGSMILWTIPEFIEPLLNYFELFRKDLFSDKSCKWLLENLKNDTEKYGLTLHTDHENRKDYQGTVFFGTENENDLNISKKQNNTVKFYSADKFDMTGFDNIWRGVLNFGTLIDNQIVSNCLNTTNPLDNKVIDIGICTLDDYKQKGYAVSNVVSMAEYLLSGAEEVKKVKEVIYTTGSGNINSQKTAKSSGLREIAKEVDFCCRRIL